MSYHGRRVIARIDDAILLQDRHPVLFARLSNQGTTCLIAGLYYYRWLRGESTSASFSNDSVAPTERRARRRRGRAAKAARKRNRSRS